MINLNRPTCDDDAIVRQSDAQAAIAARDAEIERLRSSLEAASADAERWAAECNARDDAITARQPAPEAAQPAEMSPEFTDTARAALLWVLWHHQGGSSPVGQPVRFALGMGAHDRLSEQQIAEAKRWSAQVGSTTAEFHRAPADTEAQVQEVITLVEEYRTASSLASLTLDGCSAGNATWQAVLETGESAGAAFAALASAIRRLVGGK